MSFEYYSNWWLFTKKQLEEFRESDEILINKGRIIRDRKLAGKLIGGLYVKYVMIVKEIDTCLDQMAQPQKRATVRKLMDSATIRMNELYNELKKVDISEFHYVDGNLVEYKLVPYDIEILHPALFYPRPVDIEDLVQRFRLGKRLCKTPSEYEIAEEDSLSVHTNKTVNEPKQKLKMYFKINDTGTNFVNKEEIKKRLNLYIVRLIQTAERARQSRIYFFEKVVSQKRKKVLDAAKKESQKKAVYSPQEELDACITIQRFWRGYIARRNVKQKERERRLLIGMTEPSWKSKQEFEIFNKNLETRRAYRDQRMREYLEAIDDEKVRIVRIVAPGLFEDIGDEIREWFRLWYIRAKNFDTFPSEEKGGSILIIRGETITPEQWLIESQKKKRNKGDKLKEKQMKEKLKKQKAEKKKKEVERKKLEAEKLKMKKKSNIRDFEFKLEPAISKKMYDEGESEFKNNWDTRKDADNPLEKHYLDIITEQTCYEVQLDVRKQVDELMRLELELLEDALQKDRKRLGGKKGKKKKKKKKKKGKKKGKGKKDMTKNRSTEDLFQELIDQGIIRSYIPKSLDAFKGDFSYKNWELRNMSFDPPVTLLDVRQAIIMNCIVPIGVESMKKHRSVLLAGPPRTGKHLLASAIFTETKSVLFDLSPEVVWGKYPGKKGTKMLIHLVTKMSKILAPSIIFVNGAEKIFYKKVPKDEKYLEPKRIGKGFIKGIVKTIKPEDRVLVLGITNKPWAAQAAKLKKAFELPILIPKPDYGSINAYWKELLMPYHGVDREINLSCLTSATLNYTLSDISNVVKYLLTPRRILRLKYEPLKPEEILEIFILLGIESISDKEYNKFLTWYKKTPLGRVRNIINKIAEEKRDADARMKERENKKNIK